MNIKYCFVAVMAIFFALATSAQDGRQSLTFNSGWFFHKGDVADASSSTSVFTHWQSVLLPHTWNDTDVLADNARGYYRGIGWYKRAFRLKAEPNKRYFLRFDGVNQESEVYVNGELAGTHTGGYTAFNVDITPYLLENGQQVVAIKVDNGFNENIPPLTADFTFFGGIYRPVHLITTGKQTFSMSDYGGPGVYIRTPKVDAQHADVELTYHVRNYETVAREVEIATRIYGKEGDLHTQSKTFRLAANADTVITVTANKITGYSLWGVDEPHLYRVESILSSSGEATDRVIEPLGFRWFQFDANTGFSLNGKAVKLMGANRHQDRIPYGNAVNDDMHRQDMALLEDMGGNFLRTAHYPQAREVLDLADQKGILVWEEIPIVNEVTRNEQYSEVAHRMLREMIKQHYNHPSIIIWAYMNEIYWAHRFKPEKELPSRNAYTLELAKSLETEVRDLDPYRYTAMAMHNYPAYEETGIGDIPMIAGWNLYHGWYYDEFEDFGKYMDEQHRKYPHRIHIISEYGAGAHVGIYSERPERFDFSVEGQIDFTQSLISQILVRPYIAGASLWNLVDFSSESRVDATPHINNKGLVTADRQPKDAYLLTKALLTDDRPVLEMGYPFRKTWVYAAQRVDDTVANVRMHAFSNLDSVELFVDGVSQGYRSVRAGKVEWSLSLAAGRHVLSVDTNYQTPPKFVDIRVVPFSLPSKGLDLAVNLGANYSFTDERTDLHWIQDQDYVPGSWGVIGGERLYIANKIGTKEDILGVHYEDGLYQTMRVGLDGFRADVPDGEYEIELLMVDYVPKSRRFVDDKEVNFKSGERVFDVAINDRVVVDNLDLGGDYGQNVPVRLQFKAHATGGQGLSIRLNAHKGKTVLSAVRIRNTSF